MLVDYNQYNRRRREKFRRGEKNRNIVKLAGIFEVRPVNRAY
jgi:hypothetical protein